MRKTQESASNHVHDGRALDRETWQQLRQFGTGPTQRESWLGLPLAGARSFVRAAAEDACKAGEAYVFCARSGEIDRPNPEELATLGWTLPGRPNRTLDPEDKLILPSWALAGIRGAAGSDPEAEMGGGTLEGDAIHTLDGDVEGFANPDAYTPKWLKKSLQSRLSQSVEKDLAHLAADATDFLEVFSPPPDCTLDSQGETTSVLTGKPGPNDRVGLHEARR